MHYIDQKQSEDKKIIPLKERLCVSKVFHDALVAAPLPPPTYLSTTQKYCYT